MTIVTPTELRDSIPHVEGSQWHGEMSVAIASLEKALALAHRFGMKIHLWKEDEPEVVAQPEFEAPPATQAPESVFVTPAEPAPPPPNEG